MKESQFIKQSEKKWKNFEEDLKLERKNPERTSKLFIQITDDLSYARTYYPNRMVRKYLDGVSQVLLSKIYKNQRTPWCRFINFWTETLPLEIFRARRTFLISFIIFLVAFGIGVLSSIYEPEFARVILGDGYVNMTDSNIENDDPMAVYKEFNALNGFASITMNNIRVAFFTFVFGVLAAIGSVFILLYNGIMVGAFQYYFIQEGVFWESFLTIWQHGTIEISAIIIAGAAGLTLGKGLVFTGSYTRLQSFKISGQRGLMIFLGTIPLFIIAGFIEGFITRDTDASPAVRIAVIIVSLLFILYYFGWYPRKVAARNEEKLADPIPVEQAVDDTFEEGTIYGTSELVRLSFVSILKRPFLIIISLLSSLALGYVLTKELLDLSIIENEIVDDTIFLIQWMTTESLSMYVILSVFLLFTSTYIHSLISKKSLFEVISIYKIILALSVFLGYFDSHFWILLIIIYPVLAACSANSYGMRLDLSKGLLKNAFVPGYLLMGFLSLLSLGGCVFICLLNFYVLDGVYLVVFEDYYDRDLVSDIVYYMASFIIPCLSHLFLAAGYYFFKFSQEETFSASMLMNRIKKFKLSHS